MKREESNIENYNQAEKKEVCRFKNIWEGKKILVADDESTCRFLIKQILRKTQIEIINAKNGQEAIDACNKHKDINIALIDYKMPIIDGEKATEKIKNMHNNIPVVVHTHDYQYSVREKCKKAGCNDIIYKPLRKMELLEKVEKWINIS